MKMFSCIFTKWRVVGKPRALFKTLNKSPKHINFVINRAAHTDNSHRSDIDRARLKAFNHVSKLSSKQATCEGCHSALATEISFELCHDSKRQQPFHFKYTSYCSGCWDVHVEEKRNTEPEYIKKRAAIKERLDLMMEKLDHGVSENIEQVPVKYATTKIKIILGEQTGIAPAQLVLLSWVLQSSKLREDLRIKKVKKQWICDKSLIDTMDLKLWLSYHWPLWDSNNG